VTTRILVGDARAMLASLPDDWQKPRTYAIIAGMAPTLPTPTPPLTTRSGVNRGEAIVHPTANQPHPETAVFLLVHDAFWSNVDQSGECWIWLGMTTNSKQSRKGDYGITYVAGRRFLAHRLAYIITHGAIPAGMLVCHSCDNQKCVRPDHLWIGTHRDNMADMVAKGRGKSGRQGKLSDDQVREVRRLYAVGGTSYGAIGRRFGVTAAAISHIVRGIAYRRLLSEE
jgi:hypothetical protein